MPSLSPFPVGLLRRETTLRSRLAVGLGVLALLFGAAFAANRTHPVGWSSLGGPDAPVVDGAIPALRLARPGSRSQADISPGEAWEIATAAAGPGRPEFAALQELGGRLVYVLLMEAERDGRVIEVIVDAESGEVVLPR